MENKAYSSIIGSANAPYINSLAIQGAVAGNYLATDHPSLPNYLEVTSGTNGGITANCTPPGAGCTANVANLADRIEASGRSWKAYQEDAPGTCPTSDSYPYVTKHNPWVYYDNIRTNATRCNRVVPYTQLASDLATAAATPNYLFITPNMCNDMHDCSIQTGDTWLSANVPSIFNSPAFTTQKSLLVIVWDEDDFSSNNQVAWVAVGYGVKINYTSSVLYNHYSFLKTIETSWGLPTLTSNDGSASAMTDIFGISAGAFKALYTLDGYGGIHGDDSAPLTVSAYWPGWKIARTAKPWPSANSPKSGFVLDGWGGLHPYGAPGLSETQSPAGHYWPGWDIARDFAFLPDGTGGVVLDGWGGLHAFHVNGSTGPISIQTTAYWPYWDIARKVVIFSDGSGGYVMDGWGGLHPFGINGAPPVSDTKLATTGYWPWWDIARDVVLVPGNGKHAGYVLDGWGGLHPFHPTADGSTMPAAISSQYWPGWDIARAVWLLPGSATAGYTLDGWGGLQPFGGAPAIKSYQYWPGWDIARGIFGA